MNGERKCSSIQQMAFGNITSLLILELAIIRRFFQWEYLPQTAFTSTSSTDTTDVLHSVLGLVLEVEGRSSGKGLNFTAWMVSMASLQMLTSHPFWAACLVSKGPAASPAESPGKHRHNFQLFDLMSPNSVCRILTYWTSSTGLHAHLQQADNIWDSN